MDTKVTISPRLVSLYCREDQQIAQLCPKDKAEAQKQRQGSLYAKWVCAVLARASGRQQCDSRLLSLPFDLFVKALALDDIYEHGLPVWSCAAIIKFLYKNAEEARRR